MNYTGNVFNLFLTCIVVWPTVIIIVAARKTWLKYASSPDAFDKYSRIWRYAILTIIISAGVGFGLVLGSIIS